MKLCSIVHNGTACGKSLVDARSALATQQVRKYCEEQQQDILTTEAMVYALQFNGGIPNTIPELFCINRGEPLYGKWNAAMKIKDVTKFNHVAELQYNDVEKGTVLARFSPYSDGNLDKYVFGICTSCTVK